MKNKKLLGHLSDVIILVLLIIFAINLYEPGKKYIRSDGQGYYGYLPAIFIYNDLDYKFYDDIKTKYYNGKGHEYRVTINNKKANKTWPGLALLWLPFFLVAQLIASLTNLPADGYSFVYQISVLIAAFFYLWLGLLYLRKLLKLYNIPDWNITIISLLIVFATPLLHYVAVMPSFTHAYSFVIISMFLYYLKKRILDSKNQKALIKAAFLFGLIIIIRPVNGIIIFAIPFLCGSLNNTVLFFTNLFNKTKPIVYSFLMFIALIAIIPALHKLQVNEWFVWQYRNRVDNSQKVGFNFFDPNFFNLLFSYRKGLFIYSPILFIGLGGFIPLFRKNTFQAVSLLLMLVIVTYVLSSWHSWYYGMSFGMRAMIEYLPLFALLRSFLFKSLNKYIKIIFVFIGITLVAFNFIQHYQYRKYIQYWAMDKEMYWKIFLKTDNKYIGHLYRVNRSYETPRTLQDKIEGQKPHKVISNDFENAANTNDKIAHSGNYSLKLPQKVTYLFQDSLQNLMRDTTQQLIMKGSFYIYPLKKDNYKNRVAIKFVFDSPDIEKLTIHSDAYDLKHKAWNKIEFIMNVSKYADSKSKLDIFSNTWQYYNFLIDDFKLEFYSIKSNNK